MEDWGAGLVNLCKNTFHYDILIIEIFFILDFENDYKTLYPWFMESIWWVFKQLFVKGLVYRGFKVMPFSTACSTPLSNFESGQNYKDVQDPAGIFFFSIFFCIIVIEWYFPPVVIVSFPLDDEPTVSILAWTTTPWTLPSNLALCVHPTLDYVRVKGNILFFNLQKLQMGY